MRVSCHPMKDETAYLQKESSLTSEASGSKLKIQITFRGSRRGMYTKGTGILKQKKPIRCSVVLGKA